MEKNLEIYGDGETRLDKLISDNSELSRSAAAKLIERGFVTVGEKAADKKTVLKSGEIAAVTLPEPEARDILPENIPLDIVYEDEDLLVVNKPKGMVVHPAAGHYSGTLVNALMFHCKDSLSGINGEIRPGIVHRIDKDTSGLLIVAKNDFAHIALSEQIKAHSFTREYQTVVCGCIKQDGTVNAPIGRAKQDRKKMCVTAENSREAVSHYFVIRNYAGYTHLAVRLETGRTHRLGFICLTSVTLSRAMRFTETESRSGSQGSAFTRKKSGSFTREAANISNLTAICPNISRNF